MSRFTNLVGVYPVSGEQTLSGCSDREWLEAVLAGGVGIVQLRDKASTDRQLLDKAKLFRRLTSAAGALFIVNDRVDIALLADADGVHLGQDDLRPSEVRHICKDMIIGLSCNTEKDVMELSEMNEDGECAVSYYNIGPLYSTDTKDGLTDFIGKEAIATFSRHSDLPFTVMGGIKLDHVDELVACGVRKIAVVTAISKVKEKDMKAETLKWQKKMTLVGKNSCST
jgi:thiamine-phosphate pyrophosphorylase